MCKYEGGTECREMLNNIKKTFNAVAALRCSDDDEWESEGEDDGDVESSEES
jgi:hypothetical protein